MNLNLLLLILFIIIVGIVITLYQVVTRLSIVERIIEQLLKDKDENK